IRAPGPEPAKPVTSIFKSATRIEHYETLRPCGVKYSLRDFAAWQSWKSVGREHPAVLKMPQFLSDEIVSRDSVACRSVHGQAEAVQAFFYSHPNHTGTCARENHLRAAPCRN